MKGDNLLLESLLSLNDEGCSRESFLHNQVKKLKELLPLVFVQMKEAVETAEALECMEDYRCNVDDFGYKIFVYSLELNYIFVFIETNNFTDSTFGNLLKNQTGLFHIK